MKYANGFDPEGEDDVYPLMALVELMGEAADDIGRALDCIEQPDLEETSHETLAYIERLKGMPEANELFDRLKEMLAVLTAPLQSPLAELLAQEAEREQDRDETLIFVKG